MTFTVTLNATELDAEERQARGRRAREILESAAWAFDELISERARMMIEANTPDEREDCHRMIRATADMKAHLLRIVQNHEIEVRRHERHT